MDTYRNPKNEVASHIYRGPTTDAAQVAPTPTPFRPTSADIDRVYVTPTEKCAQVVRGIGLHAIPLTQGGSLRTSEDWSLVTHTPTVILSSTAPKAVARAETLAAQILDREAQAQVRIVALPDVPGDREGIEPWFATRQRQPIETTRRDLERLASDAVPFGEDELDTDDVDGADDQKPRLREGSRHGSNTNAPCKEPTQAEFLRTVAESATYFHTPDGKSYATVRVRGKLGGERVEHHSVRSKAFRGWLIHQFYRERAQAPSRDAMENTINALDAKARFDGPEQEVHIRVAAAHGPAGLTYYLDLADDLGRVIEITFCGWEVLVDAPVKFRRPSSMRPLPVPQRGGSIEDLRPFVNIGSDNDWRLFIALLCAYIRPTGPFPILAIQGEQGSAKTTTARVVARLIDPCAVLRSMSRDEHSLAIAADRSWVVMMDNLSGLPIWMSDALCRLATGGGFATRTKYSDDEETIFSAMRPIVVNGIDDIADRPDLLDRAIVLSLPRIKNDQRRTEEKFWLEFDACAPTILGALLDAVVRGLDRFDGVQLDRLLRMADFTRWGEAVGRGLGWDEGAFLAAFEQNQKVASVTALEACPVAGAIRNLMDYQAAWSGTATDLLDRLAKFSDETTRKAREWPKQPNALSNKLKRTAPVLRKEGVEVEFGTNGKQRAITITRVTTGNGCERSSASSASSGPASSSRRATDDGDSGSCEAPSLSSADQPDRTAERAGSEHERSSASSPTVAGDLAFPPTEPVRITLEELRGSFQDSGDDTTTSSGSSMVDDRRWAHPPYDPTHNDQAA